MAVNKPQTERPQYGVICGDCRDIGTVQRLLGGRKVAVHSAPYPRALVEFFINQFLSEAEASPKSSPFVPEAVPKSHRVYQLPRHRILLNSLYFGRAPAY